MSNLTKEDIKEVLEVSKKNHDCLLELTGQMKLLNSQQIHLSEKIGDNKKKLQTTRSGHEMSSEEFMTNLNPIPRKGRSFSLDGNSGFSSEALPVGAQELPSWWKWLLEAKGE